MNVVQFPQPETRAQRLNGVLACLSYLQSEATQLDLPMLAHIIGVAREEAREATQPAANRR